MTLPRRPIQWRSRQGLKEPGGPGIHASLGPVTAAPAPDIKRLVRVLERKQRLAAALPPRPPRDGPFPGYFERCTYVSFRLDGLQASEVEIAQALASGSAARACRSRSTQRVRNHVAILRQVETLLRRGQALESGHVLRWYTSIACGLSCGQIDRQTAGRGDRLVSTTNSPQLRLGPAVQEVPALRARLVP